LGFRKTVDNDKQQPQSTAKSCTKRKNVRPELTTVQNYPPLPCINPWRSGPDLQGFWNGIRSGLSNTTYLLTGLTKYRKEHKGADSLKIQGFQQ